MTRPATRNATTGPGRRSGSASTRPRSPAPSPRAAPTSKSERGIHDRQRERGTRRGEGPTRRPPADGCRRGGQHLDLGVEESRHRRRQGARPAGRAQGVPGAARPDPRAGERIGPVKYPASVDELTDLLGQQAYLADRGLATAIYLGISLGRPILLEGEPGVDRKSTRLNS